MFLPSLSVLFGEISEAVDSLPDMKYRCASNDVILDVGLCICVLSGGMGEKL